MVEGARLESVYTSNRIVGSNPTLSAKEKYDIIVNLESKRRLFMSGWEILAVVAVIYYLANNM